MNEFLFLFRMPATDYRPSQQEIDASREKWNAWFGGIAAQGKLGKGRQLAEGGQVLKAGGLVTDGPFVEIKEQLGGYITVMADTLDEATTLAHGCPCLDMGGSVEVRPLMPSMMLVETMKDVA